METLGRGFSFSSTTLPETNADCFWENDKVANSIKLVVSSIWLRLIFISESVVKIRIILTAETRRSQSFLF